MENIISFGGLSADVQKKVIKDIRNSDSYFFRANNFIRQDAKEQIVPLPCYMFDLIYGAVRIRNEVPHMALSKLSIKTRSVENVRDLLVDALDLGVIASNCVITRVEINYNHFGDVMVEMAGDAEDVARIKPFAITAVYELVSKLNSFAGERIKEYYSDQGIIDYFYEFDTAFLPDGIIVG